MFKKLFIFWRDKHPVCDNWCLNYSLNYFLIRCNNFLTEKVKLVTRFLISYRESLELHAALEGFSFIKFIKSCSGKTTYLTFGLFSEKNKSRKLLHFLETTNQIDLHAQNGSSLSRCIPSQLALWCNSYSLTISRLEYRNYCFWKEKSSPISLIINSNKKKLSCLTNKSN